MAKAAARIRPLFVALVLACGAMRGAADPAADPAPSEEKIKAAFLLNFLRYVKYPGPPPEQWRLCLAGDDGIGEALKAMRDAPGTNRPWVLLTGVGVERALQCHLYFVGHDQRHRLSDAIPSLQAHPVLLVTDAEHGAQLGAGISIFQRPDGRLAFDISLTTTRQQSLELSSHLLRLARRLY